MLKTPPLVRKQAHHQPARLRHPEEVPRMHPDPALQQLQTPSARPARAPESAAPHTSRLPPPASAPRAAAVKLPVQLGQVRRHPLPDLLLNRRLVPPATPAARTAPAHSSRETYRQSPPAAPAPAACPGPVATIHAAFICGSPAILLSPLTTKTGTPSSPAAKLWPVASNAVVQKDLVHNQRQVKLPAQPRQLLGLPRLGKVPRRVVRMHQHNGPRLGRDRPAATPPAQSATPGRRPAAQAWIRTSSSAAR